MNFEVRVGQIPTKSWISETELYAADQQGHQGLLAQTIAVSSLPMAFHHTALMADAHSGFGMPIGGVLALKDAICPAAVGYDIGCGMLAFRAPQLDPDEVRVTRDQLGAAILEAVPCGEGLSVGLSQTELERKYGVVPYDPETAKVSQKAASKWYSQLGTLGGGNHFIEFGVSNNDGHVWVVIHSGSRGVGHAIAGEYMKTAKQYCSLMSNEYGRIPKDLSCLPVDHEYGQAYIRDLKVCLDWALKNREIMASEVQNVIQSLYQSYGFDEQINVHHNDANLEDHFGEKVWVHRKGATRANKGEALVIPGNMGQGTAICTGKGNPDSFRSSSHGAGRAMGRKQAKRELDLATEDAYLASLDVVLVTPNDDGALDERPAAYKSFPEVMAAQDDLVRVDHMVRPMLVVKG